MDKDTKFQIPETVLAQVKKAADARGLTVEEFVTAVVREAL